MSTTTPRLRVVTYSAKSTSDDKESIKTQRSDCLKLADEKDLDVVAEYYEQDESAYKQSRGPELAKALAHCERLSAEDGKSGLIIPHSDRLARGDGAKEAKHLVEYALWGLKHNVTIFSNEDQEMFVIGDYGLLMSTIGGIRNHQDSKRKGTSVKAGMLRRAELRTLPNGGPAGYGFRYKIYVEIDKKGDEVSKKRRIHDPVEAPILRRIFEQFAAEKSQTQITRDLNSQGIPSHRGKRWYQGTVSKLLRCNLVIGRFTFQGVEYQASREEIPPIIDLTVPADAALWQTVQARLAENVDTGAVEQVTQFDKDHQPIKDDDGNVVTRPRAITKGRGRNPYGSFVFRKGMLKCGSCGSAMMSVTRQTRTEGVRREVYACQGRKTNGLDSCSQMPVKRAMIDTAVLEFYQRVAFDMDGTRATIAAAHGRELSATMALKAQSDRDAAKAQERLARVKRDYLDGALPVADWHELRDELTAELEASKAKSKRLSSHAEAITAQTAEFDAESELLRRLQVLNAEIGGKLQEGARLGADGLRAALRGTGIDHFVLVKAGVFYSDLGSHLWRRGTDALVPQVDADDEPEYPSVDGYVIQPMLARTAAEFDLRKTALDLSDFEVNRLTITSSPPRSRSRTQCTSSLREVRTITGVSVAAAHNALSAPRSQSSSARVVPLTSTTTTSGVVVRRRATAWSRSLTTSTS